MYLFFSTSVLLLEFQHNVSLLYFTFLPASTHIGSVHIHPGRENSSIKQWYLSGSAHNIRAVMTQLLYGQDVSIMLNIFILFKI